jgi:hypothetical protein
MFDQHFTENVRPIFKRKMEIFEQQFSIFYRKRWTYSDPCEPRSRPGRHTERRTRALVHSTGENALLFPAAEVTRPWPGLDSQIFTTNPSHWNSHSSHRVISSLITRDSTYIFSTAFNLLPSFLNLWHH